MTVETKGIEIHIKPASHIYPELLAPINEYILEPEVSRLKLIIRRIYRHSASGGNHFYHI